MPGDRCVICGNTRAKDNSISLHRFPSDPERRQLWMGALQLQEDEIKPDMRVCSRHFREGDAATNVPNPALGKRFASAQELCETPEAQQEQHQVYRPV